MMRSGWRYILTPALRSVHVARPPLHLQRVSLVSVDARVLAWPVSSSRRSLRVIASTNPSLFRRCDRHSSHDAHGASQETDPLKSDVAPPSPNTMENAELNEAATDAITEPRSWRERAQTFALEYGRVGVCTHIVLSIFSFSVIYVGVSSGVDVSGLLESVGFSPKNSTQDSAANSAGSFLIAYTVYKLLSPVRWPLTFAVTPVVMRALRRRGYMLPKPVKPHGSPVPPEASPRRGNGNNDQGTAL